MTASSSFLGDALLGDWANSTIGFDAAASDESQPLVSTLTWTHTAGSYATYLAGAGVLGSGAIGGFPLGLPNPANPSSLLVVDVALLNQTNQVVSGITYNGVPLVFDAVSNNDGGMLVRIERWHLASPPQGAGTVVVTFSVPVACAALSSTWWGVRQGQPFRSHYASSGAGLAVTGQPTPQVGDVVLDSLGLGTTSNLAADTPQVSIGTPGFSDSNGGLSECVSYATARSSTGWTWGALTNYAYLASAMEPELAVAVVGASDYAVAGDVAHTTGQPAHTADSALSTGDVAHTTGQPAHTADACLTTDAAHSAGTFVRTATDYALAVDTAQRSLTPLYGSPSSLLGQGMLGTQILGGPALREILVTAADSALASDSAGTTGAYRRFAADTALTVETLYRVGVYGRTASDSALAVDTNTSPSAASRTAQDTAYAWDAVSEFVPNRALTTTTGVLGHAILGWWMLGMQDAYLRARTAVDSALAADMAHGTVVPSRLAADSALALDAATRSGTIVRVAADPALASDVATGAKGRVVSAIDGALADDVATAGVGRQRLASDAALTLDFATRVLSLTPRAVDSALAADMATPARAEARAAADAALTTDAAHAFPARFGFAQDQALAADTAVVSLIPGGRSARDSALASDAAGPALVLVRSANDAAFAGDVAIGVSGALRSAADSSLAADSATGVPNYPRFAQDSALALDYTPKQLVTSASDKAPAIDAATSGFIRTRTATDQALASDQAFNATIRSSADTCVASDSATGGIVAVRYAEDWAIALDTAVGCPRYSPRTWVFGKLINRWRFGTAVVSTRPLIGSRS